MTNYYNRTTDFTLSTKFRSADLNAEFDAVETAMALVAADVDAAALAVTTAGSNTTSTTSNSIGTGSKTWTVETGKSLVVGMFYRMASTASPTTFAAGTVTAYNSSTGSLTLNVTVTSGSGTITAWTGSLTAAIVGGTMTRRAITGADTVIAGDNGGLLDITSGTFTLSVTAVATLGAGFWCIVRNSGSGILTIDPNSSETIDGSSTATMYENETRLLQCDGSNLRTLVLREPKGVFHLQDQKTSGTAGQTISATTQTKRDLNTTVLNTITGASVASSVITLPAGTYKIDAALSGVYAASAGISQIRLRNTSDSTTTLRGVQVSNTSASNVSASMILRGQFTISASKNFELQHYVTTTGGAVGGAASSGEVEVYADVYIERV